jgi:hypothetical protein
MAKSEASRAGAKTLGQKIAGFALAILSTVLGILSIPFHLLAKGAGMARLYKAMHVDFTPRPDDIFIVSYPRSGTTWVQMILYQLVTDGDMDIPHMTTRSPFFEAAIVYDSMGRAFEGLPSPRVFKSHLQYKALPKGAGKYIYIARNGKDVLVSLYHHSKSGGVFGGTFEQFFKQFVSGRVAQHGSWFRHVAGWYAHRDDPNILFLTYEMLKADLESSVMKIIDFCGLEVPPEKMPAILERCSFEFMKKYEAKFDPVTETMWHRGVQRTEFIRKGQTEQWREYLDSEQEALFERERVRHLGASAFIPDSSGRDETELNNPLARQRAKGARG